jgi:hypothetical protein
MMSCTVPKRVLLDRIESRGGKYARTPDHVYCGDPPGRLHPWRCNDDEDAESAQSANRVYIWVVVIVQFPSPLFLDSTSSGMDILRFCDLGTREEVILKYLYSSKPPLQ